MPVQAQCKEWSSGQDVLACLHSTRTSEPSPAVVLPFKGSPTDILILAQEISNCLAIHDRRFAAPGGSGVLFNTPFELTSKDEGSGDLFELASIDAGSADLFEDTHSDTRMLRSHRNP